MGICQKYTVKQGIYTCVNTIVYCMATLFVSSFLSLNEAVNCSISADIAVHL